jgi:hypothetical protein
MIAASGTAIVIRFLDFESLAMHPFRSKRIQTCVSHPGQNIFVDPSDAKASVLAASKYLRID